MIGRLARSAALALPAAAWLLVLLASPLVGLATYVALGALFAVTLIGPRQHHVSELLGISVARVYVWFVLLWPLVLFVDPPGRRRRGSRGTRSLST